MALSALQITKISSARDVVNEQINTLHSSIKRADALLLIDESVDQPYANTEIDTIKTLINAVIIQLQLVVA